MSGRVEGKVALVTGAGRGQGRSHAVRLAEEGADIIAVDICRPVDTVTYPMADAADLAETARLVEAEGRRVVTREVDVRDYEKLAAGVADGIAELGGLEIVVANAGIASYAPGHEISDAAWNEMIDIDLKGVWHSIKAAAPTLLAQRAGSVVICASAAGLIGSPGLAHYVAAKHGAIGLMRAFANELGPEMIRVNAVCPTQVDTPMIMHGEVFRMFRPDLDNPTKDDIVEVSTNMNLLPVPWVENRDVSNAVLFLASDEARYVTGLPLTVDAGISVKVAV
ncbi:MAG: mycofactocin-coupled SDR family oxidoreductase [Actinobacteria bacterium]|nr:mycofactocin-coupled SDR family oxidoreductase [Actinomycetota bacterium]